VRLHVVLLILGSLILISCGDARSALGPELPTPESWTAEHPQSSEGIPFHLVVDMFVGDDFEGESVEVSIDGARIVEGVGHANPDEHCNWYGPYLLMLDHGSHQIEVTTGDGLALSESFDLEVESHAVIMYKHPSSDPQEMTTPELTMLSSRGRPGCL
jgi:hypothetical protein